MVGLLGAVRADHAYVVGHLRAELDLTEQAQLTQADLDSTSRRADPRGSDSESRAARCLMPIPRAEPGNCPVLSCWCQAVRLPREGR